MSTSDSRWARIRDALLRKKTYPRDYRLEELVAATGRGRTGVSERLEPSETLMRRAELLYRMEPLIFSGVNRLTRRITGCKIYFSGGTEEENAKALRFMEDSGLLRLLPHLVKDAFIYGFGVAEINIKGTTMTVSQIDPKEFDYQRDGMEIKLDARGNIAGFVWKKRGQEVLLKPSEVLLIRFYTLGEYCLGISPIEPAFKTAWIKLNLEEALGEAIFRHGFPTLKFKIGTPEQGPWHEITPEKIAAAKKIIGKFDTASELVLPWWMDAEIMRTGRIAPMDTFLQLLSIEILSALEIPKGFGVETRGAGRGVEELDFEKTILAFQEELKRQLEEQILKPYYRLVRFTTQPKMVFTEYAPELQNIRLRRLSAYAKHGLITRTDELENALRQAEGFPLKRKKIKKEDPDECIFQLGTCPVRKEEAIPLDRLATFCNICVKRMKQEQEIKSSEPNAK